MPSQLFQILHYILELPDVSELPLHVFHVLAHLFAGFGHLLELISALEQVAILLHEHLFEPSAALRELMVEVGEHILYLGRLQRSEVLPCIYLFLHIIIPNKSV